MGKLIYRDKEYSDCISTTQDTKFPLWMRLSILFGVNLKINIDTYTENLPGDCISEINISTYDIRKLIKYKTKKK